MKLTEGRERLPGAFEKKYRSEPLKEKIADLGMWAAIPAVRGGMGSKEGLRRLKENDLLFSFIDEYFPDDDYAFEPNMKDGRYVFLPAEVTHQGIGVCVSLDFSGFLEVGHFWYPCEYTEKRIDFGPGQVYVSVFSMRPGLEMATMLRKIYMGTDHRKLCTFPFGADLTVTLKGYFLDQLNQSTETIRKALKNEDQMVQRNGEGLIHFMKKIMKAN